MKAIPPEGVVSDLKGMTQIEALSILEPMGPKVEIKGKSKVKKQSPNAGANFNIYQKITLKP